MTKSPNHVNGNVGCFVCPKGDFWNIMEDENGYWLRTCRKESCNVGYKFVMDVRAWGVFRDPSRIQQRKNSNVARV